MDRKSNSSLSIIGDGIDFQGEVNTEGNIHIDGIMKGVIKAYEVVIGPQGDFDGEINAEVLIINGIVKGKFNIKNLHIRRQGLLQGRAKYEIIIVESGGKIQGELGISKQGRLVNSKNNKEKNINTKDKNSNNNKL